MTDRELMQQALEALEWNLPVIEDYGDKEQLNRQHKSIAALRERLAQPEQEPVALKPTKILGPNLEEILNGAGFYRRQEWKGLTETEQVQVAIDCGCADVAWLDFARAIEAKLREKNS